MPETPVKRSKNGSTDNAKRPKVIVPDGLQAAVPDVVEEKAPGWKGNIDHPRLAFTHDGCRVYKLGADKYIHARKQLGEISVVIGEWRDMGEGVYTLTPNKFVVLKVSHWNRLAGLILSGKGDLDDTARSSLNESGRLTPLFAIGKDTYFGWSRFNKYNVATIRRFQIAKNGDMFPTKSGVSFGEKAYEGLKDLLLDMVIFKDIAQINSMTPGYVKEIRDLSKYSKLKHEVAQALVNIVKENRVHSEALAGSQAPASDEEWKLAEEEFVRRRSMEAILLYADQITTEHVLTLHTRAYVQGNGAALRATASLLM